uniref:Glycosyltransferase n=1 Tax=viral metagenome TaxID=1070528 RepID=A0A6C0J2J0_9ZZZZ
MKIDIVIHSSDSNPYYLDFWPIVSKIWKVKFGVTPLLVYIDENHDIPIDETYGIVVKMKPVEGVPLYIQCCWVRFWIPTQYPEKMCMTSDIDMLPISKRYFIKRIENIPDTAYVHLNAGSKYYDRLPVCYHIARGSLFKEILELPDTFEESAHQVNDFPFAETGHTIPGKEFMRWGIDEEFSTNKIRKYKDYSIFKFFSRSAAHDNRIDRHDWQYQVSDLHRDLYVDCHSIRPYSDPENKKEIDKLVEYIMETGNGVSKVYNPFRRSKQ